MLDGAAGRRVSAGGLGVRLGRGGLRPGQDRGLARPRARRPLPKTVTKNQNVLEPKRLFKPFKCEGLVNALAIRAEAGETTLLAASQGVREWNLTDGRLVREAHQGEWVSAVAVIRIGNESMPCIGLRSGQVHLPILNMTLELDEPVEDIWPISGNRLVVATTRGIVAIQVGQPDS